MRPHWNPFRSRSTEQQRDVRSFLRNFGAGVLEMLPETLWGTARWSSVALLVAVRRL